MKIGIIGLGRMGGGIARRLMLAGHHCVVFDKDATTRDGFVKDGATAVDSLAEVVSALEQELSPKVGDGRAGQAAAVVG